MNQIFTLLILLNICHWAADYTHLSTNWMLSAKRFGTPLLPIFCHALSHMFSMGSVIGIYMHYLNFPVMAFKWDLIDWALTLQLVSHFCIDVLKGKLNVWFPALSNPSNKYHWYIFGADQFLHQCVIILMVYILTSH